MAPEYPYYAGLQLTIASHTPPSPFGGGYHATQEPRPRIHSKELKHIPRSKFILDKPPTETDGNRNPTIKQLRIVDIIAGHAKRKIQVFRVVMDGKPLIAKFYDPLFYPYPSDITYDADKHYSKEAAAYQDIRDANLEGKYTPKFHGAWTCRVCFARPKAETGFRPVRLILIEEIKGLTIEEIIQENSVFRFTPKERLTFLSRIFHIEAILEQAGVQHNDVAPRNVMLCGLDREYRLDASPKIVLIDFNVAMSFRRTGARAHWNREEKPINPIYKRLSRCPKIWGPWVPEPFRRDGQDWIKWTLSVFGNRPDYSDHPSLELRNWLERTKTLHGGELPQVWSDVDEDDYYTDNEDEEE